jgi:hypothetical protein
MFIDHSDAGWETRTVAPPELRGAVLAIRHPLSAIRFR